MASGKFISIEGVEGAGKTTLVKFIQHFFSRLNYDVIYTREPGGTEIAEEIRKVLLYPPSHESMQPMTELLLMFASRAQHIDAFIKPALLMGKWVVSDRFIDATYAYQGGGRGFDIATIAAIDKLVVRDMYPDLTLLLDIDPEVGAARALARSHGKDRIEKEQIDFFQRVRSVYLQRAKNEPQRFHLIDASMPLQDVQLQIANALTTYIEKHNL